jgi:DNA-binding GntR family transcriptional regulator
MTSHGPSVAQSTYRKLRNNIIFGVLLPETRLRLEDLREPYGASIPTLREVLNRLASEGLVVAEDQRGFAVAPISVSNLLELSNLRKLLELHALELSFAAGDTEWESRVVTAHHKLSRIEKRMMAGEACDRTEWKRYDFEFHKVMIEGCGSGELMAAHSAAFDKYLRYQMLFLTFRGKVAADEHQALLEAAVTRDIARAREVLIRHIDGGVEHARAAYTTQQKTPEAVPEA